MTTTVKAQCPGCGDLVKATMDGDASSIEEDWLCLECHASFKASEWLQSGQTRTLTDADIEAIASRVVEMVKEGA